MQQKRIALLIDCDNVSHNAIEGVLEELAKYGMLTATGRVKVYRGGWNACIRSPSGPCNSSPTPRVKAPLTRL